MLEDFPKEKLQEIYEILPEELKKALFSQEISETINDICSESNLEEKQIDKIIEYVGYVFLGILSPNDFEKAIKEKLFLPEEISHKINRQIVHLVFIPLKTSLELIHKAKIELPPDITEEKSPTEEKTPTKEKLQSRKPEKDVYREPIE